MGEKGLEFKSFTYPLTFISSLDELVCCVKIEIDCQFIFKQTMNVRVHDMIDLTIF